MIIKRKEPIRAFIFDLDGVLTDTAEYHFLGWKRMAEESGLPFSREFNEHLRGIPRRESLLLILQQQPSQSGSNQIYSEEYLQELMDRKNQYYKEMIQGISPKDLLPGARSLLEEIRAVGMKTALGSASQNARDVVSRLGISSLLDAISDGHSVARQKPAPDLFLHAAVQLGCKPGACVVVEDARAGIEAARLGGFRTMGLGSLERVGAAEVVFPSLNGISLEQILIALSQ